LKELKEEMNFTVFMRNLKTHEMEMNVRKDCELQKEIGVAPKASARELNKKGITTPTPRKMKKN